MAETDRNLASKYTLRVSAVTYREQVRLLTGSEKHREEQHRKEWADIYPLFDRFTMEGRFDTWIEFPDVPSSMRGRVRGFCDSRNRLKPGHFVSMEESPSRESGLRLMIQRREIIKGARGRPNSLNSPRQLIAGLQEGGTVRIEGYAINSVRTAMSNARTEHPDWVLIMVDAGEGFCCVRRVPLAEVDGSAEPTGPTEDIGGRKRPAGGAYGIGNMKVGDRREFERKMVNLETIRALASRYNMKFEGRRYTVSADARRVVVTCREMPPMAQDASEGDE